MKSIKKTLLASGLLIASSNVFAEAIIMDLSAVGMPDDPVPVIFGGTIDGNAATDPFDAFKIDSNASNVSTYVDSNSSGDIDFGDFVYDSVTDQGLSLDPIGDAATSENLGLTWTMNIDYYLEGFTVIVPDVNPLEPDNYVGVFTSGWANIDIINTFTGDSYDDVLEMDLVSATGTPIDGGSNAVKFSFEVTSVLEGLFHTSSGTDFFDLLEDGVELNFVANSDLSDQGNAPVDTGDDTVEGFDIYERTTTLGSIDLRLVPEPTSLAIFGLGLLGLAGAARRKA